MDCKATYNSLIFPQPIHAPQVCWIQSVPETTHAKTPPGKKLSFTVHNDADIVRAANGFEPFVRGRLIAVRDGDEVDRWVGEGHGAKGSEGLLRKGAPAVAQKSEDGGFLIGVGNLEL